MKLPVVLLAGSLAANAAFFVALARKPELAPPALRGIFGSGTERARPEGASAAAASRAPVAAAAAPDHSKYWASLATHDLPALIARLRAAGFPPAVIRAVVGAQVELQFRERMNALVGAVAETPFWKPEPMSSLNNPRFYEQLNQLYRDRARVQRELLGDEAFQNAGEATAAQRRQFGDLPRAKIDLVQRIVDDYQEMSSQVRAATQGIQLPEDREKLALLEREKRADLAAILSPAELEDYEMRNSATTSRLRQAMTLMDATEDEFRTIYKITQPLNDIVNPSSPGMLTVDSSRARQDAQAKISEAIKAALGDARFADYNRANDYQFQQLVRLGQRDNISNDLLVRTYNLRDDVAQESTRISEDTVMTVDEKRAALATLGQKVKAQIIGNLGVNAGNAFMQTAMWASAPERGWIIRVGPDGQMNSFMPVSSTRAPTPPVPPRN